MKTRNIIALALVIFGIVMSAYYLGFANASEEGLSIGFSMLGMYGSIAISVIGILIFLIGWIINKNLTQQAAEYF